MAGRVAFYPVKPIGNRVTFPVGSFLLSSQQNPTCTCHLFLLKGCQLVWSYSDRLKMTHMGDVQDGFVRFELETWTWDLISQQYSFLARLSTFKEVNNCLSGFVWSIPHRNKSLSHYSRRFSAKHNKNEYLGDCAQKLKGKPFGSTTACSRWSFFFLFITVVFWHSSPFLTFCTHHPNTRPPLWTCNFLIQTHWSDAFKPLRLQL